MLSCELTQLAYTQLKYFLVTSRVSINSFSILRFLFWLIFHTLSSSRSRLHTYHNNFGFSQVNAKYKYIISTLQRSGPQALDGVAT